MQVLPCHRTVKTCKCLDMSSSVESWHAGTVNSRCTVNSFNGAKIWICGHGPTSHPILIYYRRNLGNEASLDTIRSSSCRRSVRQCKPCHWRRLFPSYRNSMSSISWECILLMGCQLIGGISGATNSQHEQSISFGMTAPGWLYFTQSHSHSIT